MNISPKRLKEIANIPDEAIDTSDIRELDDRFWEKAKMIKPITKQSNSNQDLATQIAQRFAPLGEFDIPETPR